MGLSDLRSFYWFYIILSIHSITTLLVFVDVISHHVFIGLISILLILTTCSIDILSVSIGCTHQISLITATSYSSSCTLLPLATACSCCHLQAGITSSFADVYYTVRPIVVVIVVSASLLETISCTNSVSEDFLNFSLQFLHLCGINLPANSLIHQVPVLILLIDLPIVIELSKIVL